MIYDEHWRPDIEATYHNVSPIIMKYAAKFHAIYGGDFDDFFSQATLSFVKSYPKWRPDKSDYCTYLSNVLNWNMRNIKRRKQNKVLDMCCYISHLSTEEMEFDIVDESNPRWKVLDVLEGLSEEAQIVIEVLFTQLLWTEDNHTMGSSWFRMKKELKQYLADQLHWTKEQILNTFREIGEAL